jgi:gliding motility-associated-like protein
MGKLYKLACLLLGIALIFLPGRLAATHIVGGEMNYTCLGNNQYEITLTIFRDCYNGNPNAWFDNPASIGVFNANNQLVQQILIPLMGNDTLSPVLSSECFVAPPNVCVHTTTYRAIVTLPPVIGGYQLAYQRCCRNQTIVNIVNPLGTGATYGVNISERALLECNSNAKFQQWPPIYICVDEPISFDQSAIDADGDSIVYRLCTPLEGATPDAPLPQPPNNPPYAPINWIDPPYNVDNMLNGFAGGQPLQIDQQTGLLTGLPNTIGQFVVGICIEEYRDGELISTTRRDFQYNVGVCGQSVSSFSAPDIQCESLTVQFDNLSQGTSDYLWYFGDPNNPGASSTAVNPAFTFSDTGRYEVMLIAAPGSICADTSFQEVYLQYNSLFPDFDFEFVACSDSLTIQVTDLSVDTLFDPVSWFWELLPTGQTSTEQNPVFYVTAPGELTLRLRVQSENGCEKVIEQPFSAKLIEEELLADSVRICAGESVSLNPQFNNSYSYSWSPAASLDDPLSPNPVASPLQTTTYTVTITDSDDFCQVERSIIVEVPEPVFVEAPPDTSICSPEILLTAATNTGEQFLWALDPGFTTVISLADTALVMPFGTTTYFILVRDSFGCIATDEVTVTGNGINTLISEPPVICEGEFVALGVTNIDVNDTLTFLWSPEEYVLFFAQTATPIVQPGAPGMTTFYVEMENQFGCARIDSVTVSMIDTSSQLAFLDQLQCSGYNVQFSSSSVNAPFYVWNFGDPADPGAGAEGPSAAYTYPGPGTYEVMVTHSDAVQCPDTLLLTVVVDEPAIVPAFDWTFETCSDSAVILIQDLSVNNQSAFTDRLWLIGGAEAGQEVTIEVVANSSQQIPVTLVLTSSDGCVDSLTQIIEIELIEIELPDTLTACNGIPVPLNPDGNANYIYQWMPEEGLSDPASPNPLAAPEETTTYSVEITDVEGICSVQRTVTVQVPPLLELSVPSDTVICDEEFLLFADSPQAVDLEWSEDPLFSAVFSDDPEVWVEPGRPSTYYVRVTDAFGCSLERSLTVGSYPVLIDLEDRRTVCIGDTLQLEAVNLTEDELDFEWLPAPGIIGGLGESTLLVSSQESQDYFVSIVNEFGCELEASVLVNVFNFVPPLEAFADPDTLVGPGQAQLFSTLDNGYTYLWEPAAGLSAINIAAPLAFVEETATFRISIRDQSGCTNQALVTIVVLSLECIEPFIYVPNGFTPNGDGLNDVLYVRGNAIDEMYFAVYDRWGEKVFESESPDMGWDGTFRGKLLAPDAYGYYLRVRCFNGEEFFKKGNVTLIR